CDQLRPAPRLPSLLSKTTDDKREVVQPHCLSLPASARCTADGCSTIGQSLIYRRKRFLEPRAANDESGARPASPNAAQSERLVLDIWQSPSKSPDGRS